MPKGNNRFGAAGRGGVPADTILAFLNHYTYEASDPEQGVPQRSKFINGRRIPESHKRTIRRLRSGDSTHVSARLLVEYLTFYGFDLPWFQGWCKLHRKALTA